MLSMNGNVRANLESAVAPSTSTAYKRAFLRWSSYAAVRNLTVVPADPERFAEFLAQMADNDGSVAQIQTVVAAVANEHTKQSFCASRHEDPGWHLQSQSEASSET